MDRANMAATFMEHLCDCPEHGYSGEERGGNKDRGICYVEAEGETREFFYGDRDCSSSVCDCGQEALRGSEYQGVLDGATYTGNMRGVFTDSGLFEGHDMSFSASRGDVYLNEVNHTAMCLDGSPDNDILGEFSINEHGGVYGGEPGDQTGWESHIQGYYDYPWDGILHYNGKADSEPEPQPEPTKTWGIIQVEPNMTDNQLVKLNQIGDYVEIEFKSGKILDVKGGTDAGAIEDGREVQAHDRNGTDAQLGKLEPSGVEDAYWIVPKIGEGYSLDNLHGEINERNNIALWHKQDSIDDRYAQSWRIVPSHVDDGKIILNAKSEWAIDANPNGYNYD